MGHTWSIQLLWWAPRSRSYHGSEFAFGQVQKDTKPCLWNTRFGVNYWYLIASLHISSTSTFTISFRKHGAWSSACPYIRKFPSPWGIWRIHLLSLITAKVFITSESRVALFLFYVGFCVSFIIYFQCNLSHFFTTVSWSVFLVKLWGQTWILQLLGELISSSHPDSRFDLILQICASRDFMSYEIHPFQVLP